MSAALEAVEPIAPRNSHFFHVDPLAQLRLTDDDYAWVTHKLMDVAERHSQGRIVSVLEGGYSLQALGRSVVRHVNVLAGLE